MFNISYMLLYLSTTALVFSTCKKISALRFTISEIWKINIFAFPTLLIYTHFLYFNRIKIFTRLVTYDTWQVHRFKKIVKAVFEKITKMKNLSCNCTSVVPISIKSLLYTLSSLDFEFLSSETYGCETRGHAHIHTYQWIFGHFLVSGPQYPFF